MEHQVKTFDLKNLKGLSDKQMEPHRDVLYTGYVKKLNEIEKAQRTTDFTKANGTYAEIRELKVEEIFATNGVFLHEGFFANLEHGKGGEAQGELLDAINAEWGSFAKWKEEFVACGKSARGWVVLAYSFNDGRLHNYLMDRHDVGGVWAAMPLLILDVYEHAYMIDYATDRAGYINAFFENLNWDVVARRFEHTTKAASVHKH
jgi:superoxide dismutase, Fe-Mn family